MGNWRVKKYKNIYINNTCIIRMNAMMLWDFRSIRSKLPWFSVGISKFALWQNV